MFDGPWLLKSIIKVDHRLPAHKGRDSEWTGCVTWSDLMINLQMQSGVELRVLGHTLDGRPLDLLQVRGAKLFRLLYSKLGVGGRHRAVGGNAARLEYSSLTVGCRGRCRIR